MKLPAKVSFETAAAMMLKGLTAEYLLFRTFKVKKGHTVLVHAAAGGTGTDSRANGRRRSARL